MRPGVLLAPRPNGSQQIKFCLAHSILACSRIFQLGHCGYLWGCCLVHYMVFSCIFDLYSLDASGILPVVMTRNVSRCCRMPYRTRSSSVENHWLIYYLKINGISFQYCKMRRFYIKKKKQLDLWVFERLEPVIDMGLIQFHVSIWVEFTLVFCRMRHAVHNSS